MSDFDQPGAGEASPEKCHKSECDEGRPNDARNLVLFLKRIDTNNKQSVVVAAAACAALVQS